jgi:ATP-binding cassette subfamily B protein
MPPLLRRFLSYYRPYKKLFVLDFACAVASAMLELSFPLFVNHVVDQLLPSRDWPLILTAGAALLGVYAANAGLQFVVTYWGHMLGINIETDMRRALFEHIQKLSFRYFDNHKTGHLVSRMSTDLFDIGEVAHHGPEDAFIAIMTLFGAFGVMLFLQPTLALLTFAVVPLLIWLAVGANRRLSRAARQMFEDLAEFNARVEDNIGGIRVVQAFANEEHEKSLFAHNNRRFRATKIGAYKTMAWNGSLSYALTRLVSLFVLLCGAWFVFQGEMTNGQFVGFLLLSGILFRPIDKINAVAETYPKGIAGFGRFLEVLDTAPDVADAPDAVAVGHLRGDIRFENVSFEYEPGRPVLQNINLCIRAGETIAFVGPSGAGKTTLCSLLPRFYDVSGGSISVDGRDIRDMTLASLRRQIGIVQQDVFLFTGTMRDNIAYGNLEADEAAIWEAARRAHLEDFILAQAQGLDTLIGERGVKLSGGQKQRLAIARMFLKNPPILILDEATSALDTETERVIQKSLAELSQGRTTLVIAHRLATIKGADRIVVVTEDGISEEGRHQDLVESGGVYSRLHGAQFG